MSLTNHTTAPTGPPADIPPRDLPRLVSIDALRGFDMFWIIGGSGLVLALARLLEDPWWHETLSYHLHHPEWHGFSFYDVIFPLFLFLSGTTMPFALGRRLERGEGRLGLYWKILRRSVLLIILGMIYNDALRIWNLEETRFASVLGRIGAAYFFAALIFLHTRPRGRLIWMLGILLGYWLALRFIPVPRIGTGNLDPGMTVTDYIDRQLMPGRLYQGVRDPEGLFATVPAVATALMGALAGDLLRRASLGGHLKTLFLLIAAAASLALGWAWDFIFPINKNLWSSSFVLYAGGWSLLLLAVFYLIIDVWRLRWLGFFFVVIGVNPLTIYIAQKFIDFNHMTDFFLGGLLRRYDAALNAYDPAWPAVAAAGAVLLVKWCVLLFLYRHRIFLRV